MGAKWHHSEETKIRMSLSNSGINHPNFGKHRTEKTKQKLQVSCKKPKSIPRTEEHNNKIGAAHLGILRPNITGERHPNWKGGISFEPYCPKFNDEFKERVRSFFGYRCQICNHIWQTSERKLAVHHVNYNKNACCNNKIIPLFVPVCAGGGHAKTNYHREFWQDWFTEIINEFYDGKCYFPKK